MPTNPDSTQGGPARRMNRPAKCITIHLTYAPEGSNLRYFPVRFPGGGKARAKRQQAGALDTLARLPGAMVLIQGLYAFTLGKSDQGTEGVALSYLKSTSNSTSSLSCEAIGSRSFFRLSRAFDLALSM